MMRSKRLLAMKLIKEAQEEAEPEIINPPRDPREGAEYQLEVPDHVDLNAVDDAVDKSEVMWNPAELVDDDDEDLDSYIAYARGKGYLEDSALTLLRHLNMDMRRAYLYLDEYRLKKFVKLVPSPF